MLLPAAAQGSERHLTARGDALTSSDGKESSTPRVQHGARKGGVPCGRDLGRKCHHRHDDASESPIEEGSAPGLRESNEEANITLDAMTTTLTGRIKNQEESTAHGPCIPHGSVCLEKVVEHRACRAQGQRTIMKAWEIEFGCRLVDDVPNLQVADRHHVTTVISGSTSAWRGVWCVFQVMAVR